jgi:hypothetical protein
MAVSTGSFEGTPFPPEVLAAVWVTVLTGAPFAEAITPLPTDSGSVAFPKAAPTGAAWVRELDPLPQVNLNDDADVVAAAKLAGLLSLSNESLDDASIPIGTLVGQAIRDSMGPTLDEGLLHGDGTPPNPSGIFAKASAAPAGPDFRAAVISAYGAATAAGAPPTSVVAFAHPSVIALEWGRVNDTGTPLHGDSASGDLTIGPGIKVVGVPMLDGAAGEVLVADVSSVYLIQREDFTIEMSSDYGFANDSTALRVKARVNVNCPTPAKSLWKATITAGP